MFTRSDCFIKLLISVEFYYILFLFSGTFKESLNIPIDITALLLVLVFLFVLVDFIRNPVVKRSWVLPILFITSLLSIILISVLINGTTDSSNEKMIKFVGLTLPTYLLPLLIIKNKESIINVLKSISILAIVLSLFSLPMILNSTGLFIGFNGGNYQGLARTTGIGFLTLSFFFLTANKKGKLLILPFYLLVAFTLFSAGSRMPLLAILIVALYALKNSFDVKKDDILIKKKSLTGFSLALLLVMFLPYLYSKGYFQTIIYRFAVLFEGNGGTSAIGRTTRLQDALEMFKDNYVIGGGFGRFGDYYTGTSGVYAHNMFFEFLSELGIIGLVWFSTFLIFTIYRSVKVYKLRNKRLDGLQITLIAGFLYFFLNAMVSGDINENRAVFAFSAMLAISPFATKVAIKKDIKVKNTADKYNSQSRLA